MCHGEAGDAHGVACPAETERSHRRHRIAPEERRRHGHMGVLDRVLSLRHNFSAYDASYVALAELLDAEIVTADAPLAQAIRTHSKLRVLSA